MEKGFSIIEVILAAALFVIFASGTIAIVLFGFDMNRLGAEQTVANQFASMGLEAVRSIKNQNFSNLINTSGTGIAKSGNVWVFSGSNDVFDKYTRVIGIYDVYRDGGGNIVVGGGILDIDSKRVTSTVSWNVNPVRLNSIVLTTYLTNWKSVIPTPTTTVTPTPTVTVVPTITNTPTPTPVTCSQYCQAQGYTSGTCRQNRNRCLTNETYEAGGDAYCIGALKTCCCLR